MQRPERNAFSPPPSKDPRLWTRLISSILPDPFSWSVPPIGTGLLSERRSCLIMEAVFSLLNYQEPPWWQGFVSFLVHLPSRMDLPSSQQSWASTTVSLALNQWGPEYFLDAWLWPRSSEGEAQVTNSHSSNEETGKKSEEACLSILEVMWHIFTIVLLKMTLCCDLAIQFLGMSHKKKKLEVATFKAQSHSLQSYFWWQRNEYSLNIQNWESSQINDKATMNAVSTIPFAAEGYWHVEVHSPAPSVKGGYKHHHCSWLQCYNAMATGVTEETHTTSNRNDKHMVVFCVFQGCLLLVWVYWLCN